MGINKYELNISIMKKRFFLFTLLSSGMFVFAQKNTKYNIVFIISDQHKTNVTGCYGDSVVKTPNIDFLASEGVRFTKMYTPSPLSAPARASLMTGVYPSTNGALLHKMLVEKNGKKIEVEPGYYREGYHENLMTWGEYYKKQGYTTAAIGKMHVHGELQKNVNKDYPDGNLMGFDVSDLRFYTNFPGGHYKDYKDTVLYNQLYREIGPYAAEHKKNRLNQHLKETLLESEEDVFDFLVANRSISFMDDCLKENKPFFLHVGLEKPHEPWTTFKRFYEKYQINQMKLPNNWKEVIDNGRFPYVKQFNHSPLKDSLEVKKSMLAYYACVSEMDEAVGRIIKYTKENGIYDNTIFIYTTDHGEHLFEHGLYEKHNMFEAAVNIPFIISCPSLLPSGVVCNSLSSLIDVLPTISELLGLPLIKQWEGKSLLEAIKGKENKERFVFSEFYQDGFEMFPKKYLPLRMLLDNNYKYIYTHGVIDQLYDIVNDPQEMNNLALNIEYHDILQTYRIRTLNNWDIFMAKPLKLDYDLRNNYLHFSFDKIDEAKRYILWYSSNSDIKDAVPIISSVSNEIILENYKKGCYWISADWNFTRYSNRKNLGKVCTENYPEKLPISNCVLIN